MKINLLTVALGGLLGTLAFAGNAEACHKKACGHKAVAAPVCAPAAVVYAAPVACAPKVKKCHFKMPTMPKIGCHKKAAACATPVSYASYSAPVYGAPQAPIYAAPQASMQN